MATSPDAVGRRVTGGRADHHPIRCCRAWLCPAALGIPKMEDEAGVDGKVLAAPTTKILPMYENWKTVEDGTLCA